MLRWHRHLFVYVCGFCGKRFWLAKGLKIHDLHCKQKRRTRKPCRYGDIVEIEDSESDDDKDDIRYIGHVTIEKTGKQNNDSSDQNIDLKYTSIDELLEDTDEDPSDDFDNVDHTNDNTSNIVDNQMEHYVEMNDVDVIDTDNVTDSTSTELIITSVVSLADDLRVNDDMMTSDADIVMADNMSPDIVVPDIVVPDIVVPDIVVADIAVTDYTAEPDYSPNVSYDYENKIKLFNFEEAKNFASHWVNNLDLETKKEYFKAKLVDIIAEKVDSSRVSLHSLNKILLNAYREFCESPLALRPPPSSPCPPAAPSNNKDV